MSRKKGQGKQLNYKDERDRHRGRRGEAIWVMARSMWRHWCCCPKEKMGNKQAKWIFKEIMAENGPTSERHHLQTTGFSQPQVRYLNSQVSKWGKQNRAQKSQISLKKQTHYRYVQTSGGQRAKKSILSWCSPKHCRLSTLLLLLFFLWNRLSL